MSMIKINHWVLLGTLVAALPLMAIDGHAQNNAPRSGFLGERGARAAPQVSLQQAIDIALSENGGRVLSAQSKMAKISVLHGTIFACYSMVVGCSMWWWTIVAVCKKLGKLCVFSL